MELQFGDVIGYRPKTFSSFLAAMIKIGGKQKFTHVMLYIGDNQVIETNDYGVAIREYYSGWLREGNDTVARLDRDLTKEEQETMLNVAHTYLNRPYGFFQFPLIFLYKWLRGIGWVEKILSKALKIDDPSFVICSELISRVYKESLNIDISKQPDDFTLPDDVMDSDVFMKVFP
jgi:uncharacterized protein YycO